MSRTGRAPQLPSQQFSPSAGRAMPLEVLVAEGRTPPQTHSLSSAKTSV